MRWLVRSADPALVARLSAQAQVSPLLARLAALRGVETAEAAQEFFHPQLAQLHSPYRMLGMKAALERLRAALANKETILIYGDYDADGTLAVVILKTALDICGGQVDFHVPHRIREGYGMRDEVIEQAAAAGVHLVISVDNGIRAFAAAQAARRAGVDLIVTDHHLPESAGLPQALAVVNPNQSGCEYPCKSLCGAGVAFKIAQALLEESGRAHLLPSFLKLVAIATVADAVPLRGENRAFVRLGLEGLRSPVNLGLKALLESAGLWPATDRSISAGDLGFRLGPRINAAGRMDVARDVIELFSTRHAARAAELAAKLNRLNAERQQQETQILEEICDRLERDPAARAPLCLVLEGANWHRGVIGIVATRVVERFHRPALLIACDSATGEGYGSGRSLPAFPLLAALEDPSCRHLLTRFGGHAHAAGFALPLANIPQLRQALASYAAARLSAADLEPVLEIDAELRWQEIDRNLMEELQQLSPCGVGNPEPVFLARAAAQRQPLQLLKQKHLKLRVGSASGGRAFDAIGWRMAERAQDPALANGALDLAFTLEQNPNPDFPGLQLILNDFQAAALATTSVGAPG